MEAARHGPGAGLLVGLPGRARRRRRRIAEQLHALADASGRPRPAGRPTRRWPGGATSTPTSAPGRSCAGPTTRRSGCAWTASTSSPAAATRPGSATSPATSCSSCSSPTPRTWTWTCCSGAATTGCSPGRAPSTCRRSWATCSPPATPGRCRSRCSTTCSARPTRGARRSTPCARCSRCRRSAATGCRPRPAGTAAAPGPDAAAGFAFAELAVDDECGPPVAAHARRARVRPRRARTAPSRCSCGSSGEARVLLNAALGRDGRGAPRSPRSASNVADPAGAAARRRGAARPGAARATAARPRPTCPRSPHPTGRRCSSAAPAPTTAPSWLADFPADRRPPRRRPATGIDRTSTTSR